jgi:hypothetical protein
MNKYVALIVFLSSSLVFAHRGWHAFARRRIRTGYRDTFFALGSILWAVAGFAGSGLAFGARCIGALALIVAGFLTLYHASAIKYEATDTARPARLNPPAQPPEDGVTSSRSDTMPPNTQ